MFESLVDLTDFYPQETMSTKLSVAGSEPESKAVWNSSEKKPQEFYLSDNDFPLLESKPEVDRKCKKVRRHAGVALMQKKLADRGYIIKNVVEDHGVGKKRKARLLSEQSDDFQAFVPYSLNRKNRWNTIKLEDCLTNTISNDGVKVSGVEGYLSNNIQILATKYMERKEDDMLVTRVTHSMKGVPVSVLSEPQKEQKSRREVKRAQQLEELLEAKENIEQSEEVPELHVQYTIAKSHPVTKFLLGKYGNKGGRGGRGKTTRRVITHAINKNYLEDCGEVEIDAHDEDDLFARPPRRYTLADYITQDTSPVMINAKSIQSINDESTSETETKPSGFVIQPPKIFKDSIFVSEKFRSVQIGIHDWLPDSSPLEKCPDLRFHWLNPEKTKFTVDLTHRITENPSPSKMELVLFFEKLVNFPKHTRVLFNASFKSHVNIEFLKREISCYNAESLEGFLDVVAKRLKKHYSKSEPTTIENVALKSAFNSRELSLKAEPWSEYRIIDVDTLKHPVEDAFMITDEFFESMIEHRKELDEESDLEDFEQIEMEELLSDSEEKENPLTPLDSNEIELVTSFGQGCDICDETNEDDIQMLENCGHKFCTNCLRIYLTQKIHAKCLPLNCFHCTCKSEVPLNFLPAVLPLPLVSFYLRFQFVTSHLDSGNFVTECPDSKETIVLENPGDFGQIHCAKCGVHWCLVCKKAPHWPLNCEQASEWDGKFSKQYKLDGKRENCEEYMIEKRCYCGDIMQYGENREQVTCDACTRNYNWQNGKATRNQRVYIPSEFALEMMSKTKLGNLIAQPYSAICSEMKTRRYDLVTARQFAKQARKLSSVFKMDYALMEHRKVVLHLLEFGYAWLYMTRIDRPSIWTSIKANLSNLRGSFDVLENEILNSEIKSINIDVLIKKIDDSIGLTKKTIDELKIYVN